MGETVLGNRYEIIRKIGDGGMAFVYEAKDRLLNRTVAVKVLRPEFVDDEEFLGKFKREAEAVASLSHPNIVNVYDVGEDGKVHYIVMEFIDGQNLKEIIKNEGVLDEYTALDITKQIAMALSAAHRKGIIHRDIKPHNILISNEGRIVKVADFGIAKAVSNSTMTNIGSIIGSVHYFSPEQAKGKFVTSNADLYSLGIVLYEMLIGKVPFRGDSPISIALQHINDNLDFTQEEKVRIPQSVRTIIKKLTEKSSADRYQSAEELIEDIEYIEKNIDLDFIKEYDNYATQKIEDRELRNSMVNVDDNQEEAYDDYEDEDEYEDPKQNRNEKKKSKNSNRRKKEVKEDSPLMKKILVVAAVILIIILGAQVYLAGKYLLGSNSNQTGVETVITPDVKNMSLDEAQRKLDDLGLNVTIKEEYDTNVEANHVISQMPEAGKQVKEGDSVTIVLSKGKKQAQVPNVVGLSLIEAESVLRENNLVLGNVKQEFSESFKEGNIIRQTPQSGTSISGNGEAVDVVVSKGPKPVAPPEENKKEESDNTQTPPVVTPDENQNTKPETGNGSNNSGNSQGNSGESGNTTPEKPGDNAGGNTGGNTGGNSPSGENSNNGGSNSSQGGGNNTGTEGSGNTTQSQE
ncbi:Stk1 family PASTA domain-containing Ser/Thr kinase [Romboutsia sp. 1001216sp1]|uniref:Stk1 family PASTA domain-containing Ser/Thr kinase n=1 Tax=Romboutsia sp. 1001216sp1 TaxID=2986997 RepID=UPI00232C5345|nr:Stk1 family PASTA domain-containing Ser/Thr kinase [Romboutsia sp. 1001216sp1]MDB8804566.1 Stk1 family PASTA domain-containing Ser/Thr kinase [Romboutsia sp. 1001216sp1]MDB8806510.1 Stk1 family PASTA domain-containing Ser/Thr kinase [Romboutsia sp. 1001216sp1]MDB8810214.1 Stk1 family PASTA domain-containing Ser/Thr kinase [Romboutsia sp. 1001216sp1]MDB8815961.1 Stk1 family PASTA domain-containing Ser/Thr kinase [Romboutsia sp. 1001216sp1]MDB8818411.1 Stk1 family PASTA domain-containing Ser/